MKPLKSPWFHLLWIGTALADEPLAIAHPEQKFDENRTVIWTPTFQAGWDAMNAEFGGPPKESGSDLGKKLDTFEWKPERVMPEGKWKVWAGEATLFFGRTVNKEAAAFLNEAEGPFEPIQILGGRAAYALLDTKVSFKKAFYRSKTLGMNFCSGDEPVKNIQFFGVRGSPSGGFSQIRVLEHSEGVRSLEIPCSNDSDETVILYMPKEELPFSDVISQVRTKRAEWTEDQIKWLQADDPYIHQQDIIRIPYLSLDITSEFKDELQGNRVYGQLGDPHRVAVAWQKTGFSLDESGATVRVSSGLGIQPFGDAPPPPKAVPRDFSFDRPFFVFLWRDEAEWPYFAAWIGDSSAMLPFKP